MIKEILAGKETKSSTLIVYKLGRIPVLELGSPWKKKSLHYVSTSEKMMIITVRDGMGLKIHGVKTSWSIISVMPNFIQIG